LDDDAGSANVYAPEAVNTFQATTEKLPDPFESGNDFVGFESQPAVVLSPEQKKVLQMVKDGRNVFFTGSAGLNFSSFMAVEYS
jgi:hypothetical protein